MTTRAIPIKMDKNGCDNGATTFNCPVPVTVSNTMPSAASLNNEFTLHQQNHNKIQGVNWHVWSRCNYKCKFCFFTEAGYLNANKGVSGESLCLEDGKRLLGILASAGIVKINFAGGEPTLYPHISEYISAAVGLGISATIVTNGTGLTDDFLDRSAPYLSAIKLSLESASDVVEKNLGRGWGRHVTNTLKIAQRLKDYQVPVMLNSVVTSRNCDEDLSSVLEIIRPLRWKVFKFLSIEGQNTFASDSLSISDEQFEEFISRHSKFNPIAEDNDAMTNSYLMIDPVGRLFQNTNGRYSYSPRILEVGFERALESIYFDYGKFIRRGGAYHIPDIRESHRRKIPDSPRRVGF